MFQIKKTWRGFLPGGHEKSDVSGTYSDRKQIDTLLLTRFLAKRQRIGISLVLEDRRRRQPQVDFSSIQGAVTQQFLDQHQVFLLEIDLEGKIMAA